MDARTRAVEALASLNATTIVSPGAAKEFMIRSVELAIREAEREARAEALEEVQGLAFHVEQNPKNVWTCSCLSIPEAAAVADTEGMANWRALCLALDILHDRALASSPETAP